MCLHSRSIPACSTSLTSIRRMAGWQHSNYGINITVPTSERWLFYLICVVWVQRCSGTSSDGAGCSMCCLSDCWLCPCSLLSTCTIWCPTDPTPSEDGDRSYTLTTATAARLTVVYCVRCCRECTAAILAALCCVCAVCVLFYAAWWYVCCCCCTSGGTDYMSECCNPLVLRLRDN